MGLNLEVLQQRHQVVQALTDEFSNPTLGTWFTGSFAKGGPDGPPEAVAWSGMDGFARRLGQMTHSPVPAVVVVESMEQDQRTNVHALIGGIDHLPTKMVAKAWKLGNVCVMPAEQPRHARYLAKKVAKGTSWQYNPTNRNKFTKAVARVRVLERRREDNTDPVVYDAGGRVIAHGN